jgi:hypothetical protein
MLVSRSIPFLTAAACARAKQTWNVNVCPYNRCASGFHTRASVGCTDVTGPLRQAGGASSKPLLLAPGRPLVYVREGFASSKGRGIGPCLLASAHAPTAPRIPNCALCGPQPTARLLALFPQGPSPTPHPLCPPQGMAAAPIGSPAPPAGPLSTGDVPPTPGHPHKTQLKFRRRSQCRLKCCQKVPSKGKHAPGHGRGPAPARLFRLQRCDRVHVPPDLGLGLRQVSGPRLRCDGGVVQGGGLRWLRAQVARCGLDLCLPSPARPCRL